MYWFKCLVPSYQLISHIPYQDLVSAVENVSIQKESEPQAVQKKKKKTISKKEKEIRDVKLPGWLAGDGRKQQRQRQWTGEWRRREAKKQRSAVNRNRKAAAAAISESEKQRRQQRSAESQRSSSAMWGFGFVFNLGRGYGVRERDDFLYVLSEITKMPLLPFVSDFMTFEPKTEPNLKMPLLGRFGFYWFGF